VINRRSLLGLFATAPIAAKIAPAAPAQEIIPPIVSVEELNAIKAEMGSLTAGTITSADGSLVINFSNGGSMTFTDNESSYEPYSSLSGNEFDLFEEW
jgi:hypothetical protein